MHQDDLRPNAVGRYLLTKELGRGGMGTVWLGRDEMLGRDVAVKQVTASQPGSAGQAQRDRAMREARAAARLNHPGAVTVHDIVEVGGDLFIVMELVTAPTLAQLVKINGPLPPARAAKIGERLLAVLEAAHRAGIVHRDVKPSNVMILPGDDVKLADFGIASLWGDPRLTISGAVLGTPGFMAPEQASGEPVGPATDLWSLGATLYFAVEGRPPYARAGVPAVLAAIITQPPDTIRLAGPLGAVLTMLLAKSREERPAGDELRRLLAHAALAPRGAVTAAGLPTSSTLTVTNRPTSLERSTVRPQHIRPDLARADTRAARARTTKPTNFAGGTSPTYVPAFSAFALAAATLAVIIENTYHISVKFLGGLYYPIEAIVLACATGAGSIVGISLTAIRKIRGQRALYTLRPGRATFTVFIFANVIFVLTVVCLIFIAQNTYRAPIKIFGSMQYASVSDMVAGTATAGLVIGLLLGLIPQIRRSQERPH